MPERIKKDRQGPRGVSRDIEQETLQQGAAPHYRNRNRDEARGDWDRTGRQGDEEASRDEASSDTRPEELYPAGDDER
jgi:hypothetical protein